MNAAARLPRVEPRCGDVRVNAIHYDGIVVELFSYWNGPRPTWGIPNWIDWGDLDLGRPFASVEEAEIAIAANVDTGVERRILPPVCRR